MSQPEDRTEQWKNFTKRVVSLTLSLTLVQIWVGFILTRAQSAFESVGVSSPTQDVRALVVFTATIVGVYMMFDELEIVNVPAGFSVLKFV